MARHPATHGSIPRDFPVRPLRRGQKAKDRVTCGHCHLSWDDAKATRYTPAPSGRCPFEAFHVYEGYAGGYGSDAPIGPNLPPQWVGGTGPVVVWVKTWKLTWNPVRPNTIYVDDEGKHSLRSWSDSALRYDDGRIAYDFPERVPQYVKNKVRSMFRLFR